MTTCEGNVNWPLVVRTDTGSGINASEAGEVCACMVITMNNATRVLQIFIQLIDFMMTVRLLIRKIFENAYSVEVTFDSINLPLTILR
jgi:hypothetical protein